MTKRTPETSETTILNRFSSDIYENTITVSFEPNIEDNSFRKSCGSKPIVPTLLTWASINDTFYYNFIKNKDKGPAKRKVTFG